jgi:hypothetical protein
MACDGCTVFFSLTPFDEQSSAGLIFRFRSQAGLGTPITGLLHHRLMHGTSDPVNGVVANPVRVRQTFASAACNLRLVMPVKFVLQVQLPYRLNSYSEPDYHVSETGLGDLTVMLGWQGIEWRKGRNAFRFTPMLGVKAPTGWQYSSTSKAVNLMDVQGGSGTVDLVMDPNWILRINEWGFGGDVAYRVNGTNSYGMRYANQINLNMAFFRVCGLNDNWELLPSANVYLESSGGMYHQGEYMEGTQASLLSIGGGLQCVRKNWNVRLTALLPGAQWLDNPQPREKVMVQCELSNRFSWFKAKGE